MRNQPLVSVIVTTKNSQVTLKQCLDTINNQTYKHLEIIVVDNHSTDKTTEIAEKFTNKVFNHGMERSEQRNFGVKKSRGNYLLFIDSDMELSKSVIDECVKLLDKDTSLAALAIPEESIGEGFWASCK